MRWADFERNAWRCVTMCSCSAGERYLTLAATCIHNDVNVVRGGRNRRDRCGVHFEWSMWQKEGDVSLLVFAYKCADWDKLVCFHRQ